tara:strand:- start:40 stop:150 length:111 start_codon:yes stop_codon:yes gene_type:complete
VEVVVVAMVLEQQALVVLAVEAKVLVMIAVVMSHHQ